MNQSLVAFIQSASGDSFIIQERAPGITLEEVIKAVKAKLPEKKQDTLTPQIAAPALLCVRAAFAACEEVQRLHKMDIIHRDIKPKNIMFDEKTNKAKLIDLETLVHLGKVESLEERTARKGEENSDQFSGTRVMKDDNWDGELVFHAPLSKKVGTSAYLAPEIARSAKLEPENAQTQNKVPSKFKFKKVEPNFQVMVRDNINENEWGIENYEGDYSKSSDKYALGLTIREVFIPILQLNDGRIRECGNKQLADCIVDLKNYVMAICREAGEPNKRVEQQSLLDERPARRASITKVMEQLKKYEELLMKYQPEKHSKLRT